MVSRDDKRQPYFGSMGIYLFNIDVLLDMLEKTDFEDFGTHVIPAAVDRHNVYGFDFDGYWADIGTIRSFYEINLSLASKEPPFTSSMKRPSTLTRAFCPAPDQEQLPRKCAHCRRRLDRGRGYPRCGHRPAQPDPQGVLIKDSVIMGADYYDTCRVLRRGREAIGHWHGLRHRRRHPR